MPLRTMLEANIPILTGNSLLLYQNCIEVLFLVSGTLTGFTIISISIYTSTFFLIFIVLSMIIFFMIGTTYTRSSQVL
jgi:hypothetical protein